MAKEWILNIATNRWGLNKKENVGPVSEWIRECNPKTVEEWREYYLKKLKDFLSEKGMDVKPSEYLEYLGKKLYTKITEVIRAEICEVSEEDCINYICNLVINRTFEGFQTEVETIYKLLERELSVKIKPAPDEWDRLYNSPTIRRPRYTNGKSGSVVLIRTLKKSSEGKYSLFFRSKRETKRKFTIKKSSKTLKGQLKI